MISALISFLLLSIENDNRLVKMTPMSQYRSGTKLEKIATHHRLNILLVPALAIDKIVMSYLFFYENKWHT